VIRWLSRIRLPLENPSFSRAQSEVRRTRASDLQSLVWLYRWHSGREKRLAELHEHHLRNPEVYGLRQQDVNPLLQFVLLGTEEAIPQDQLQDVIRKCQWDCARIVNNKVRDVLSRNAAEAVILQNREPVENELESIVADDDEPEAVAPVQDYRSNTKRNGSGSGNAAKPSQRKSRSGAGSNGNGEPKVSVKQLRYIGYLQRQLDEEPDYKAIAELTQRQATSRIRELEKELASK